jgi:hypothetical protein
MGRLFGRIIVSAAGLVALVVASAAANVPGLPVVTVLALIVATAGVAHAGSVLMRDAEGDEHRPRLTVRDRRVTGGVAAGFAVTAALAIVLAHGDARATAMTPATPATAGRAVRAFLSDAIVLNDAYGACQYLSPSAQQQVSRIAGDGQTCREALTETRPGLDGVDAVSGVRALRLRTTIHDGTARVSAAPSSGRPPTTFVLRPASAAEASAYRAPVCAWRIVRGEAAVLGRPAARAA